MGGASSNEAAAGPMLDADIQTFAGVAFHQSGVFVMSYDGSFQKTGTGHWSCAKVALPDGRGNIICLHDNEMYILPFTTSLSTHKTSGHAAGWSQAQALVRQPSDPEHFVCFHGMGVYKIKVQDGSYRKIGSSCWSGTQAAVAVPDEPGFVYIFHSLGLYKVSLADGGFVKVGSGSWEWARAAVYLPSRRKALVFHCNAIYHVNLADGSSESVSTTGWSAVRAAVPMKDDSETVLAIHDYGVYHVKVADGSFQQVSKDGWRLMAAFAPLGEDVLVSCKPFQAKGGGGGGGGGGG